MRMEEYIDEYDRDEVDEWSGTITHYFKECDFCGRMFPTNSMYDEDFCSVDCYNDFFEEMNLL